MTAQTDSVAIAVFLFFFIVVTVAGFAASRWKNDKAADNLSEWGLGGRRFGPWIIWFLLGGDLYTAYTMIALPAAAHAIGAYSFFALPYGALAYPIMFVVLPRLWKAASKAGHITAADAVLGSYGSRTLALAVAISGIVASMPYIALQLIGMETAIGALGIHGEFPLTAAFVVLALYTYSAGLRAPALIAFIKDVMIYITMLAIIILLPGKLGGYATIFQAADAGLAANNPHTGILLQPGQYLAFASVAMGSSMALFMYPHAMTAIFSARDASSIRKNAIYMPLYSITMGLIALSGYMAYAMPLHIEGKNGVLPALIKAMFPSWFGGFAYSAIAISALVPAAVISIGCANLFTRNIWKTYVKPDLTPAGEAQTAKLASLLVKAGALLIVLFLPTRFALDLHSLGGTWILQTFPAIVVGVFYKRITATPLLTGLITGQIYGTYLSFASGMLNPLYTFSVGEDKYTVYAGMLALIVNVLVVLIAQGLLSQKNQRTSAQKCD